jgi:hypothetical protein
MVVIAHVTDHVPCLSAGMRNLAYDLTKRSLVAPGNENERAASRQLERDSATDPFASACNQCHPPRERPPSRHFIARSTLTGALVPTMYQAVSDESDLDVTVARARKRAKRIALVLVSAVAVLFISASALQIIRTVFGLQSDPVAATLADPTQRACALGVSRLARALDRASSSPLPVNTQSTEDDSAKAAFRLRLSPDCDSADTVMRECEHSFWGLEAWAALERLRRTQEELSRGGQAELILLRRDVSAHLPPDLR